MTAEASPLIDQYARDAGKGEHNLRLISLPATNCSI